MPIPHPNAAWFVDIDDGTIIHFFDLLITEPFDIDILVNRFTGTRCPAPGIFFIESTTPKDINSMQDITYTDVTCGMNENARPIQELDLVDALPTDFAFSSGRVARFEDRISLFLEEFTPSRIEANPILVGSNIDNSVRTFITRYDFVNTEEFTSTGQPNQVFTLVNILTPTLGTSIVTVNGERWTQIPDLNDAGPTDKVYEYDEDAGELEFGGGQNGAIPPDEAIIILRITIKNGGGFWQYAGIVVEPIEETNLSIIGAIEDKLLFATANIAINDIGKFEESHTILNGNRQETYFRAGVDPEELVLVSISQTFQSDFGGTFEGSGGDLIEINCSTEDVLNYPSFSVSLPQEPGVIPPVLLSASAKIVENGMVQFTSIGGFNQVGTIDNVPPLGLEPDLIQFHLSTPYVGDRIARPILVGNVEGTFDDPVVTGLYGPGGITQITITGTGITFVTRGTTDLGLVHVIYECRLDPYKKALAEHLEVDDELDDFLLEFVFSPGTITDLPPNII